MVFPNKIQTAAVVVGQHDIDQIDSGKKIPASGRTRGDLINPYQTEAYFITIAVNG
jgi:hypothetical protein